MVSYVLLAFIGVPFAIGAGILLASLLTKKSNIRYLIIQSFIGNEKILIKHGYIDVSKHDVMAEHNLIEKNKKIPIGTFHQKYLKPMQKGYLMLLEEYDKGRYRPLVLSGVSKDNQEYISKLEAVPNDDVNFILRTKEEMFKLLQRDKKENRWLSIVANLGTLIIVGVVLVLVAFYQNEASNNYAEGNLRIEQALKHIDEGAQAQKVAEVMLKLLTNQTVRDLIPATVEPPPEPPG